MVTPNEAGDAEVARIEEEERARIEQGVQRAVEGGEPVEVVVEPRDE